MRDIAILWVNPSVVASLRPLPLGCGQARPSAVNGQELYAVGTDMTGQKRLMLGDVTGVGPRLILTDLRLVRASAGGPVFAAGGLIGFTTVDDRDPDARSDARIVRIDQACEVMASVEKKMAEAMPPDATHMALEPLPVAVSALSAAVKNRAGSLSPYPMSTTDFDISFITPVHIYGAKDQVRRPVMEFGARCSRGHPSATDRVDVIVPARSARPAMAYRAGIGASFSSAKGVFATSRRG